VEIKSFLDTLLEVQARYRPSWIKNITGIPTYPLYFLVQTQRDTSENLKQIFPEKELCGHRPNFHIQVSVSDLYIPTINLPQENMWTNPENT
jgi:hypothetical protein